MKVRFNSTFVLLVVAFAAVAWGVYRTERHDPLAPPRTTRRNPSDRSIVVDQSSLITAEALVRMPTTPEERTFAQDALRLADQDMDLAFGQAVRMVASQPRVTTPETQALETALRNAQRGLATDQAQVKDLTAALATASPETVQSITDRLNLAKAQAVLDQDEIDDSSQDLQRAGGDPQGRMQAMIEEHDAASRSSDSVRVNVVRAVETHGLVAHLRALQNLYEKEVQLRRARFSADSLATALKQRHDRMEQRAAARLKDSSNVGVSRDSVAALLATTQRRALSERARATLDQRVDIQRQLIAVYDGWIGVMDAQERLAINRSLKSIGGILLIILVAMLIARWIEHVLRTRKTDDRVDFIEFAQFVETRRTINRECLESTRQLVLASAGVMTPEQRTHYLGLVAPAEHFKDLN